MSIFIQGHERFMSAHLATVGPRLRSYIGVIHGMPKEWIRFSRAAYTENPKGILYITLIYIQGIF